jgi:uncharacterized repeat protein (TIGR01451 family)
MNVLAPRTLLAMLLSVALASPALAQDNQTSRQSPGAAREHVLQVPPGNPVLQVNVQMPEELRAGESYDYNITVSNMTDDLVVHDIVLMQKTPDGVEIQSSKSSQTANKKKQDQNNKQAKNSDDNSFWDWQWDQQQSQADASQKQGRWTISKLMPGKSTTISLTAVSDKVGQFDTCLAVKSYTPALCLTTKYVKPEIELVKQAPERANLCEQIEYTYFVKNTGSGDAQTFTISDPLPQGIQTVDGKKKLEFKVDGLKANDTRKFVATLLATETGNFGSRAKMKLKSGSQAHSNKPMTDIQQADLAVSIEGPDTEYINRPLNYKVTVTNKGNAPAPASELMFSYPAAADVARVSEVRKDFSDKQARNQDQPSKAATPKQATKPNANLQLVAFAPGDAGNQNANPSANRANESWKLGTLQAGESRTVSVVLRHNQAGMLDYEAIATFACDIDKQQEKVRATANHETELIALPALLLTVVDNTDPVRNGEDLIYSIIVINQGDAPDHEVKVAVELPQGLQFVSADGPTEAKSNGKSVSFGALKQINAGQRVEYLLTTKVSGTGDILLKTTLDSKAQSTTATSEEPTRLFKK